MRTVGRFGHAFFYISCKSFSIFGVILNSLGFYYFSGRKSALKTVLELEKK